MSEAVQQPVQDRDGPVQVDRTYKQLQRRPGDRAILVSERETVFDQPRADLQPADPMGEITDPIWDNKAGTRWTPDLVHCRLIVTGEIMKRLPPVIRRGYVSQLGNLVISPMSTERRIPPSAAEISLADWTLNEIASRRYRQQMLLAAAFGVSFEKIAEAINACGQKTTKSTVHRWYLAERRSLAGHWQARRIEPMAKIDRLSYERWEGLFDRSRK